MAEWLNGFSQGVARHQSLTGIRVFADGRNSEYQDHPNRKTDDVKNYFRVRHIFAWQPGVCSGNDADVGRLHEAAFRIRKRQFLAAAP
jgi:hypothetical protein